MQLKLAAVLLAGVLFGPCAQAAVFHFVGGVLHFAYEDSQGAIHDVQWSDEFGNGWTVYQINLKNMNSEAGTNGPPAAGDPFASESLVGDHYDLRFTYRDSTGAIQDVLTREETAIHLPGEPAGLQQINLKGANPNARTAGPAAAGNPFVINVGTDKHFVYRDSSGTIWDAWYHGSWTLQQINSSPWFGLCNPLVCFGSPTTIAGLTNGPPAAGDPSVAAYGQQLHYAYRDANGNIQDAWYDGTGAWHLDQINNGTIFCGIGVAVVCPPGETPGPPAAGDPVVLSVGNELHFAYRDNHGRVWDSYNEGNGLWGLDQVPMGNSRAASGPVASFYDDALHFAYRDLDGVVYDAFQSSGDHYWNLLQLNLGGLTNGPAATTSASAAPGAGDGLSVAVDPGGVFSVNGSCTQLGATLHFAYRDAIGAIQHIWYDGVRGWYQEELFPQTPAPCTWPLQIVGPTKPLAFQIGRAVSGITFSATGGTPPYTFSALGLPQDGLSLSSTGALTGTPAAAKTFPITVTVRDSTGAIASENFTVTVSSSTVSPSTWTLSFSAAPVSINFFGVPFYIDTLTWVVTPDWSAPSRTVSYPPIPVTLPVPPAGGPNTVTITVSGTWSTPGGLANGIPIGAGTYAVCTSFDSANAVCNATTSSWKVAYTGHPSETVSWLFTTPYVYDPSSGTGNVWVVLNYNGVNP
ncbi:MAG: hypothetical protein JO138_17330 [Acidobacteriaceae bacterium]|nr:hypothetical protein [Acidobacteriaceae bacterium]